MRRFREILADWASILGLAVALGVLIFNDQVKAEIALGVILLCVISICIRFWLEINRHLRSKYPRGYSIISSMTRYSTGDGRLIKYDLYKTIQCKKVMLWQFDHEFKWSGTKSPMFQSDHQKILDTIVGGAQDWDVLRCAFENPLRYNETEVVHIGMTLDDSDQRSDTCLVTRVPDPTQLLVFRVELFNRDPSNTKPAILTKTRMGTPITKVEQIREVHFDPITRSYETNLQKPTPGYAYKLSWERQ